MEKHICDPEYVGNKKREAGRKPGLSWSSQVGLLSLFDVGCLRSLLSLDDFKLDAIPLGQ